MEVSSFLHLLFPLAVTFHNLEEALWLPDWSARHPFRGQPNVAAGPFRFAVIVLTLTAYLLAGLAMAQGFGSFPHYLLAAYAAAQCLYVVFPHLVASIRSRSYMPGLASGVMLVLPVSGMYLVSSFALESLEWPRFARTTALVIPALLVSQPLLFRLGRVFRINSRLGTFNSDN